MSGHASGAKLVPMPFDADDEPSRRREVEPLPFSDRSDLLTLADVTPTRIEWLWPGYVPSAR